MRFLPIMIGILLLHAFQLVLNNYILNQQIELNYKKETDKSIDYSKDEDFKRKAATNQRLSLLNLVISVLACAFMITIRVTKTTCEKFYYNWMISDSIIMMLALPNVIFEKKLDNIKNIKMGKNLITSIHEEKQLEIDKEVEVSDPLELS